MAERHGLHCGWARADLAPAVCRAQYIRDKYWEYEYQEVVTPNMFNLDLWKTSGHADHYKVRRPGISCACITHFELAH